jgi:DNA-binding beta-propeller fold protein YncE
MKNPNIVPPETQFGKWGSQPGDLNDPQGLTVGPDKQIYIADTHNNRVQVFDRSGKVVRQWGKVGRGPGELIAPKAIAVDGEGLVYVADTGNARVQVFNGRGDFVTGWGRYGSAPGEMLEPCGIAVDTERVYVVDQGNERVQVFDKSGKRLFEFGGYGRALGQFNKPADVSVDEKGNLYVADAYNNRIQKFDRSGKALKAWGEWGSYNGLLATPSGVCYSEGNVFVADLINHRIQVFSGEGEYLFQFGRHPVEGHGGNGRIHYPARVAACPGGEYVVVAEPFEHRCQVFTLKAISKVVNVNDSAWWDKTTRFHYGTGACYHHGLIAVAEPDTHSVLVFDYTGRVPRMLAKIGRQGSGPGEFIRPSGACIQAEEGLIHVSDSGNYRVQTFKLQKSDGGPSHFVPNTYSFVKSVDFNRFKPAIGKHLAAAEVANVEPGKMHLGPDGDVYVSAPKNSCILVLPPDFSAVKRVIGKPGHQPGEIRVASELGFSKDGKTLFVVDSYNFRIQAFEAATGKYLYHWGEPGFDGPGKFMYAFGIASGKDGFVYVTDAAGNCVKKFDERGNPVAQWGTWGTEPLQFYKPKG